MLCKNHFLLCCLKTVILAVSVCSTNKNDSGLGINQQGICLWLARFDLQLTITIIDR